MNSPPDDVFRKLWSWGGLLISKHDSKYTVLGDQRFQGGTIYFETKSPPDNIFRNLWSGGTVYFEICSPGGHFYGGDQIRRDRPSCWANLSVIKDASDRESNNALAWAVEPLGPWIMTWHVMSNTPARFPFEELLMTFSGGFLDKSTFGDLGTVSRVALPVSWCNSVWCIPLHFLHFWDDWHWLA